VSYGRNTSLGEKFMYLNGLNFYGFVLDFRVKCIKWKIYVLVRADYMQNLSSLALSLWELLIKEDKNKIRTVNIFPNVFLYIFWDNQVSWKEEFCRGTSGTLHPDILGILKFFFCLWAEIFEFKVQRATQPEDPFCPTYFCFFENQVCWKSRFFA